MCGARDAAGRREQDRLRGDARHEPLPERAGPRGDHRGPEGGGAALVVGRVHRHGVGRAVDDLGLPVGVEWHLCGAARAGRDRLAGGCEGVDGRRAGAGHRDVGVGGGEVGAVEPRGEGGERERPHLLHGLGGEVVRHLSLPGERDVDHRPGQHVAERGRDHREDEDGHDQLDEREPAVSLAARMERAIHLSSPLAVPHCLGIGARARRLQRDRATTNLTGSAWIEHRRARGPTASPPSRSPSPRGPHAGDAAVSTHHR